MAFPKNIKTYSQWMEAMAKSHVLLAHGEGSGNTESYQEVWLSGEHFEKIDWRTFLSALKNRVKYPAMVNIGVDFNHPMIAQNGRTVANAQFAIVCRVEKGKPLMDSRAECYDTAEGIAKDIFSRIEKYFETNIRFGALVGNAETEPIGPINIDGTLYGVVCGFKYQSNVPHCYDAAKWSEPVILETE